MASQEMIQIILKAEDQASQVFKQNEQNMKRFGDEAKQANEKARQSSQKVKEAIKQTADEVEKAIENYYNIGAEGSSAFNKLSKSEQEAVLKLQKMDEESRAVLLACHELGGEMSQFGNNFALHQFKEAKIDTDNWKGSLDAAKTKLDLLGTSSDGLKGKIQVVGNAIPTYLGSKWEGVKSHVTNFGNYIKSFLSSALSTVSSKIRSLGDAFSGLGGIVSSVLGGVTLKGLSDMTIGASISRDRIFNLSHALMGAGMSAKEFKENSESLWNIMDDGTNKSLVSLDQISQAMSVIALSTGANTDQLKALEPVVLDIGQRAILMGKDGSEAVGLMQAAGKGLNGEFEMLRENLGITKEDLENAGWDGSAEDIDGYTKALEECLKQSGDVSDMMNTTSGKLTSLKKMWSVAGRSLGDEFLPYIDQALTSLLSFLDADRDGALDERGKKWMQYAYGAMAVASGFATLAPTIAPALQAFDNLAGKTKSVLQFFGILEAEQGALTITTMADTIAEYANAVAKDTMAASTVAAMAANDGLLSSVIALNVALLANPITWVVVALIALAVAVYEVGKAFGWWSDVQSMLAAVWSGINRLWSAFINHPDVQAALKVVGSALSWLGGQIMGAIAYVLKFFDVSVGDGKWDIISTLIHGVGNAWNALKGAVGWVVGVFRNIYSAFNTVMTVLGPFGSALLSMLGPVGATVAALRSVVCILLGCSPGIVPALEKVQEVFGSVWNGIAGFIGGVIATIVSAIQPVIDILTQIAEFYLASFIYAWQTLIMVFNIVVAGINRLIYTFTLFLNGQISLQTMLSMIWSTLSQMFALVLTTILSRVSSWASSLLSKAINAGRNFVNNIIRFISTLPGQFASYLTQVLYRIISAGASWVSSASSKASEMVNAMMNYISQLPGKVYTEFMNIGSRMLSAGSDLVNKARQIGADIVNGLLDAMGIHSPGTIQTSVIKEFVDMVKGVGNKIKSAYDTAKSMGEAIVEGFGNPSLETDTSNMLPSEDALKTAMGIQAQLSHPMEEASSTTTAVMDTTSVTEGNETVIGSYDNLANLTGAALESMVNRDKLAYDTMKNNDAQTLSAMTTNLQQKMTLMTSNVSSSMNNIVSKNRTGMNTVSNTTKSQLNTIVSTTKSANNEMISSWEYMRNGIINAADKIRSDSTNHFNKLSNTIGDFYGKLKNPSRWGAGSPITRSKSSSPSRGFSKITSAIRNASLPSYLTLGQMHKNPLIGSNYVGDYVTKDPKNGRFNVADLVRYGVISLMNRGAGSYDDISGPHVKLIKNTSNEWDMAGPLIGHYSTSKGFKVKEFLEGVPNIAYDTFRRIAEEVYSQTSYEFYYDDDHHGNWVNAFNAGSMNCKHGAESLIAMANAMGLSGYMQHGHWTDASGTYGHYFAVIGGHKMDVTGWQQRGTWTPSASAGPAPKRYGFKDLLEILKSNGDDNPISNSDGFMGDGKITGEFTFIHDFKNLPDGVSAEDVAKMVEDSATNEGFLKKIAQHPAFQRYDLREKVKIERQNKRARGV